MIPSCRASCPLSANATPLIQLGGSEMGDASACVTVCVMCVRTCACAHVRVHGWLLLLLLLLLRSATAPATEP
eukprot:946800-Alexandrium_andersonii.AAC.1